MRKRHNVTLGLYCLSFYESPLYDRPIVQLYSCVFTLEYVLTIAPIFNLAYTDDKLQCARHKI
jgi:hypothetical protein